MWETVAGSSTVTQLLGEQLGRLLQAGDLVSLVGDLGAGKTVLVHGIARGLQVSEPVSSPTFLLIQEYNGRYPVFHCDFYRLKDYQELEDIGWEEYFQRQGVILIEWGNRIPEALPDEYLEIEIKPDDSSDSIRLIRFNPKGHRYDALVKELSDKCAYLV